MITDFEISYEYDGEDYGGILAFNLHGHDIPLDDIELFLLDRFHDGDINEGGWEIKEDWLRKVPMNDGSSMHVYAGKPGPGAKAVTVLCEPRFWNRWCINHPYERASQGRPTEQIIDGEELVTRRLLELADEIDPKPDVSEEGYVYFCRECSESFEKRYRAAQQEALARLKDDSEEDA